MLTIKLPKINLMLMILLAGVLLWVPHSAMAAMTVSSAQDCTSNGDLAKGVVTNIQVDAKNKTDVVYGIHNQLAQIKAEAFSCFQGIDLMFGLGPLWNNPTAFIQHALENAFWAMVKNMINQVCQAALGTLNSVINQVVSAAESIQNFACIPLPSLGFNVGTIDLHLPHVPCNGTSLLPPNALFTTNPTSSNYPYLQFLGRTAQ